MVASPSWLARNASRPTTQIRGAAGRAGIQYTARRHAAVRAARNRPKPALWVLPVQTYHLTGRFGQNGDNWSSFHHGLDFAARVGTPVRAVAAGTIIEAGWDGSAYGNRTKIRHRDGTVTLYAHLSGFRRRSGTVAAGTVIGYVGATGNTTGPHVHLEVRPHGGNLDSAIDPTRWLTSKGLKP
ncbi:MAG: M23 family metallopeptidase [Actinopolymorphaceae bacterium]